MIQQVLFETTFGMIGCVRVQRDQRDQKRSETEGRQPVFGTHHSLWYLFSGYPFFNRLLVSLFLTWSVWRKTLLHRLTMKILLTKFPCHACSLTYKQESDLKAHLKKRHADFAAATCWDSRLVSPIPSNNVNLIFLFMQMKRVWDCLPWMQVEYRTCANWEATF